MSSRIMHIDMDAFFASVEQQVNPSLRGKPVIIGGRDYKYRSIICAASYEAKRLGVTSAMPSWLALKICPQAIFVPADTPKYIYTSNRIFEILKAFSPKIEKFSVDEFFLEADGCRKLFGSEEEMGRSVKEKIREEFGITCSVGAAPTKITAKLAAKMKKPDGLYVIGRDEALAILEGLPVEKICGIGERLKKRFHLLGIQTCGQLAKYPDRVLKEHFGVIGLWLKAACRVEDFSDIDYFAEGDGPPKSIGHSQTLRQASCDQQYIKDWIYLLSEMVAMRLRHKALMARTVYFYISDGIGGGSAKRKTFTEPTYDGYEIYQRCLHIVEQMGLSDLCARVLGVSVSHLSFADHHYLFDRQDRRDRLIRSVDRVNDQYGEWTVYPASLKNATYER
ncbi:MAG: DNA polymerase IV [Candidatus Omnitrophica bacterium]|nr:DNA polymerase IV [Candidatus Omnitrophota bacterium]